MASRLQRLQSILEGMTSEELRAARQLIDRQGGNVEEGQRVRTTLNEGGITLSLEQVELTDPSFASIPLTLCVHVDVSGLDLTGIDSFNCRSEATTDFIRSIPDKRILTIDHCQQQYEWFHFLEDALLNDLYTYIVPKVTSQHFSACDEVAEEYILCEFPVYFYFKRPSKPANGKYWLLTPEGEIAGRDSPYHKEEALFTQCYVIRMM